MPGKATFPEGALVQYADGGFLPDFRDDGEFYLPFLDIKDSIGRVALSKDRPLFGKIFDLSAAVDDGKEGLGIWGSNRLSLLAAAASAMIAPLLKVRNAQNTTSNSKDKDHRQIERKEGGNGVKRSGSSAIPLSWNNVFTRGGEVKPLATGSMGPWPTRSALGASHSPTDIFFHRGGHCCRIAPP